jgi:DNA-binding CsgD family transcriptional regulator
MKRQLNPISMQRTSAFRLDPALTGEEAIVLRALAVGQTDGDISKELRMAPGTFLRLVRDMREKIGTTDNVSLIEWAKGQIKGCDQRIDSRERYARLA